MSLEERVVDLEIRYTHYERLTEELSGVLYEQQRALAALAVRVKSLEERVRALADEPGDAPPPHY
ncbi:MAG: SlyX family protein [Sorangiineae bacterium]|nr:SlyX family protein [Polyangiaceae bacterium]MEB2320873.1 SlyX family protein [Sorangiineae bacterium]